MLFAWLYSSSGASYQILQLMDAGRVKPVISTTLLFEYEDVLKRKQKESGPPDDEIDVVFCALNAFQEIYSCGGRL